MRISALLSAVAAVGAAAQDSPVTGSLGNATVVSDNPAGKIYTATLPDTAFDKAAFPSGGNVKGSISAEAASSGVGVTFKVQFSHLPTEGGPFTYHIHANPVPANGNCTATLGHLDPFERLDDPACDNELKETCQVGDLSGKYGKITSDPFNASYTDLYASTLPGNPAFFGNLSFVVHYPNKTRITCANFELVEGSGTNVTTPSSTGSPSSTSSTPAAVTAGTGQNAMATRSVLAGAAAGAIFAAAFAMIL